MKDHVSIFIIILALAGLLSSCRKADSTSPVISIKGEATMLVVLNSTFTDPGATAQDNEDGNLNVNVSGKVNPDLAGTYVIKYSATDAAGNNGSAERKVIVQNSASFLAGIYHAIAILPSDTIYYDISLATSTTVNNRLWLPGFASWSQAVIFADIRQDSVIVPQQDAVFGTPPVTRSFNGKGLKSIVSDTMQLVIDFNETTTGSPGSGVVKYRRVN